MGYKLIFSDLDGTLLNKEGELSRENTEALEELAARGVRLIPATGRCVDEIPALLKEHKAIRELISSNGARTLNSKSGEATAVFSIGRDALLLLDRLRREFGALECYHANGHVHASREEMAHHADFGMNEYYYAAIHPHATYPADFDATRKGLDELDMCAWFFKDTARLQECRELLAEDGRFSLTASSEHVLEIIARGVSKGAALRRVAEQYGVPLSDTVAVGDSRNDIAMLEAAGLALAVENAAEATKEAADRVICDHRAHILPYILDHIL